MSETMRMYVRAAMLSLLFALVGLAAAQAQVKRGAWGNEPLELRQWLGRQMIPNSAMSSCCGEADAAEVEVIGGDDKTVIIRVLNGRGHTLDGIVLTAERWRVLDGRNDPNVWGRTIAWIRSDGHVFCVAPAPAI